MSRLVKTLFSLVSDLSFGVQYKARHTIEILMTIVGSYKINLWDTHIAIGVWDGNMIMTVVDLTDFGDTVLRAGNASTDGSQQVYKFIIIIFMNLNFSSVKN